MELPELAKLIDEHTEFFRKEQEKLLIQTRDKAQQEVGNAPLIQAQLSSVQSAYRRIEQIQQASDEAGGFIGMYL